MKDKPRLKVEKHSDKLFFRLYEKEEKQPILFVNITSAMNWLSVRPERSVRKQHVDELLQRTNQSEVYVTVVYPKREYDNRFDTRRD